MDPAEALYQEGLLLQRPMWTAQARGDSVVQQWYKGKTAFITGGSGYLGKLLIEKLIRSCKLKTIYVLMREKKGQGTEERLQKLLQDPVFDLIREYDQEFPNIVKVIKGEVTEIGLGISTIDREILVQEVDIIFHLAATTRFNESLKKATLINVKGTRELLSLAKQCRNLKSLVHMSTAYTTANSNTVGEEIWERFCDSIMAPDALIHLVESTHEKKLDAITNDLIAGWSNTYTFTKTLAEELVRISGRELPICVFRPAIVMCPYYEPEPGYLDVSCANGPTGFVLGVCMGVVRVIFVRRKVRTCLVPADFTTNAAITCGWKTAIFRRAQHPSEVKIYTLSSNKCNVGVYVISDTLNGQGREFISPKTLWYNYLVETDNAIYYKACAWLLHFAPACVIDAICKVFHIKPLLGRTTIAKLYKKIENLNFALSFYLTKDWFIRDDNLAELYESLTPTDKDLFCFDVTKVNWNQMILMWWLGVRKHLIKDGLKHTLHANKKQIYFKVANYALLLLFMGAFWMFIAFVIGRFI